MNQPCRGLVHEHRFTDSAKRIFGGTDVADDQLEAINHVANEFEFSRYVTVGNWQGHPLQVLPIAALGKDKPPVWVFFSVNPHTNKIHLVDVMV